MKQEQMQRDRRGEEVFLDFPPLEGYHRWKCRDLTKAKHASVGKRLASSAFQDERTFMKERSAVQGWAGPWDRADSNRRDDGAS